MTRVCLKTSAAAIAAAMLVACGTQGNGAPANPTGPTTPTPVSVRAIVVTSAPASQTTYQMTARAQMTDGTSVDVTTASQWITSDTSIATVSPSGLLTAFRSGHIYVRANYQNTAGMLDMTVNVQQPPPQSGTLALSGTATETAPAAKPLAGVAVRIIAGPDAGQSTMTDARGHLMFPPLHPGVIGVEATRDGYLLWRLTNLIMDHDGDLQIVLYPVPPKDGSGASATARCNDGSWSWAEARAEACAGNGGIAYTVCPGTLCQSTTGR
jgi:hypothetical protein